MSRARRAQADCFEKPEPEEVKPDDVGVFWRELGIALDRLDEVDDASAQAAMLHRFFSGDYGQRWANIRASWRASAGRRAMVERALLVLVEGTTHARDEEFADS